MKNLLASLLTAMLCFTTLGYTADPPAETNTAASPTQDIQITDMLKMQMAMNKISQNTEKLSLIVPTKEDYTFAQEAVMELAHPILNPVSGDNSPKLPKLIEVVENVVHLMDRDDYTPGQKAAIYHISLDLFAKTLMSMNQMTVAPDSATPAAK